MIKSPVGIPFIYFPLCRKSPARNLYHFFTGRAVIFKVCRVGKLRYRRRLTRVHQKGIHTREGGRKGPGHWDTSKMPFRGSSAAFANGPDILMDSRRREGLPAPWKVFSSGSHVGLFPY
jgi:hypothetical protein